MESGFRETMHFFASACEIAAALLLIAGLLWLVRRAGWRGPLDLVATLETWFGITPRGAHAHPTVNVEYRDTAGELVDLGPLVTATLQNGRGKSYNLREGIFVNCLPDCIKAGAHVQVSIQGGLVRERCTIQVDFDQQTLFVKSGFRRAEIGAKINHNSPAFARKPTRTRAV